mgnify:CR=1 FL=1
MTKSNRYTLLNGLLLCALTSSVLAEGNGSGKAKGYDWLSGIYATANIGRANSNTSISEVQAEFDNAGITNTTINDVEDSRRTGFGIGLGYDITANWAVELAYLDLDQVDVKFTSTQAINNLEDVHPESGNGFTVSGLYKYVLGPKTNARLRLGVFAWDADYKTSKGDGSSTGKDSDSGTDMYWGGGLDHQLTDQLTITGELQRFDFERDDTIYLAIGAEWRY